MKIAGRVCNRSFIQHVLKGGNAMVSKLKCAKVLKAGVQNEHYWKDMPKTGNPSRGPDKAVYKPPLLDDLNMRALPKALQPCIKFFIGDLIIQRLLNGIAGLFQGFSLTW